MSEAHHEPGHPPEHHDAKGKGKKGKKVGGIDQKVLVAAAVLTVILTYLLWRRSRSTATSSTDSTTANGLGGQPFSADTSGGGGGGGSNTGTSSTGGTSSGGGGPIAVVSDKADEAIALANGFLPSQLRYAGTDPNAGNPNAASLGYDAPTDLATYDPSTDSGAFDLGLSGTLNNGLSAITGADRAQTNAELQEFLGLPVTHTQAAASGTTGVSAPAPPVAGKTVTAAAKAAAPAPVVAKAPAKATVAAHPASNATTSKSHVTAPPAHVTSSPQSAAVNLPGTSRKGE